MMHSIGDRLRNLREARGMTQDDLAEKAELNRVTIAKYETGKIEPKSQSLRKLAAALDVSTDYIISGHDDQDDVMLSLTYAGTAPRTTEARILSAGIDKMPAHDRERALRMIRLMFDQYEEYFNEGTDDDDT